MNCLAPPWGFLQLFQKKMTNARHSDIAKFESDLMKITVKADQTYPPRFYSRIDYLKNEAISRSCN